MDQQNLKQLWICNSFMGPHGHITKYIWHIWRISSKICATGRAQSDRKLYDIWKNCATIFTVAQVEISLPLLISYGKPNHKINNKYKLPFIRLNTPTDWWIIILHHNFKSYLLCIFPRPYLNALLLTICILNRHLLCNTHTGQCLLR